MADAPESAGNAACRASCGKGWDKAAFPALSLGWGNVAFLAWYRKGWDKAGFRACAMPATHPASLRGNPSVSCLPET
jgi:hypothetical protein